MWENFWHLWGLILYKSKQNDSYALDFCKNREWMKMIWTTINKDKLTRRTIGSLEEDRDWLINTCGLHDDDLPLPDWWEEIKKEMEEKWMPTDHPVT